MSRPGKSTRHRWNRSGPWNGSADERVCTRCGSSAYKTGQRSGYMVDLVQRESLEEPGAPRKEGPRPAYVFGFFAKMPPCPGEPE